MTSLSLQKCDVVGPTGTHMDGCVFFQERQVRRKGSAVCKGMAGVHRSIITEEVVTSQLRIYA